MPAHRALSSLHVAEDREVRAARSHFLSRSFLQVRRAHLTLVVFDGGYRVGARQPAVQVDVGAAARAERTKTLDLRFAADGARFCLAGGTHGVNLGFP
jgi:hypothetical protein